MFADQFIPADFDVQGVMKVTACLLTAEHTVLYRTPTAWAADPMVPYNLVYYFYAHQPAALALRDADVYGFRGCIIYSIRELYSIREF